mmetsp:Transcript_50393/g.122889  ORF Transcript_50393/g.122889 Transcript_50393/m.122889 type:complete len:263 (-) Transcript_50393:445-1233(-)
MASCWPGRLRSAFCNRGPMTVTKPTRAIMLRLSSSPSPQSFFSISLNMPVESLLCLELASRAPVWRSSQSLDPHALSRGSKAFGCLNTHSQKVLGSSSASLVGESLFPCPISAVRAMCCCVSFHPQSQKRSTLRIHASSSSHRTSQQSSAPTVGLGYMPNMPSATAFTLAAPSLGNCPSRALRCTGAHEKETVPECPFTACPRRARHGFSYTRSESQLPAASTTLRSSTSKATSAPLHAARACVHASAIPSVSGCVTVFDSL